MNEYQNKILRRVLINEIWGLLERLEQAHMEFVNINGDYRFIGPYFDFRKEVRDEMIEEIKIIHEIAGEIIEDSETVLKNMDQALREYNSFCENIHSLEDLEDDVLVLSIADEL